MAGDGLIGDTLFLDRDGNGTPDAGEGIEGVTVELRDSTGTIVLATTVTDENGNYSFGGLLVDVTYQVVVDTTTLPEGLTNSVDPDGGLRQQVHGHHHGRRPGQPRPGLRLRARGRGQQPGRQHRRPAVGRPQRRRPLPAAGRRRPPGTIDDEPGIGGVTIDLYEDLDGNGVVDDGDRLLGSTVTAADGSYLFENLPTSVAGVDYLVKVVDDSGVLAGWWKSTGPNPGANDNSQADPYAVTLTGRVAGQPDRRLRLLRRPGGAGQPRLARQQRKRHPGPGRARPEQRSKSP